MTQMPGGGIALPTENERQDAQQTQRLVILQLRGQIGATIYSQLIAEQYRRMKQRGESTIDMGQAADLAMQSTELILRRLGIIIGGGPQETLLEAVELIKRAGRLLAADGSPEEDLAIIKKMANGVLEAATSLTPAGRASAGPPAKDVEGCECEKFEEPG